VLSGVPRRAAAMLRDDAWPGEQLGQTLAQ